MLLQMCAINLEDSFTLGGGGGDKKVEGRLSGNRNRRDLGHAADEKVTVARSPPDHYNIDRKQQLD